MENIKMSSIDKLNKQIDILVNEEYKEKTKKIALKKESNNRKIIKEEKTITDSNLLDDLMPDFENKTKVFAAKDLKDTVNLSFISKFKEFINEYLDTDHYDEIIENSLCLIIGALILTVFIFIFVF